MSRSAAGYHHGNLRTALEDAALELLQTQPAAKISLREVARRAGVSHNAPYHHFGDRAALLHALGVRAMSDLLAAQQAAVEAATGPVARLRALGSAYVAYAADHPQAFALVFDPEYCPPGAPSVDMAPLIAANEDLLTREVAALVELDAFADREPLALAAGFWATAHGMAQLVMLGHLPREAAEPAMEAILG